MDPEACLTEALLAALIQDWAIVRDRLDDYRAWRRSGFEPVMRLGSATRDGDRVAELLAALAGPNRKS